MLLLCCALLVSGLHWFAMQTVAWTGMMATRANEVGFVEAMRTTFDGEHPCTLCRVVEDGRTDEQERTSEAVVKFQFVVPASAALPARACVAAGHELPVDFFGTVRADSPSVPPPRVG